jgi:hypothetical protein
MDTSHKQLTMQIGGLTEEVPELSFTDHIPTAGATVETLFNILPQLPGQVLDIAADLLEILHVPDLDHELGG